MKRIFLDTNFLIDFLFREDYFKISKLFLDRAESNGSRFYVSFLSVANMAYIGRKIPRQVLYNKLDLVCNSFTIVANYRTHLMNALRANAKDFEDALQYEAAMDAGCDCIITRNAKDFSFAEIPVLSAAEYLDRYI